MILRTKFHFVGLQMICIRAPVRHNTEELPAGAASGYNTCFSFLFYLSMFSGPFFFGTFFSGHLFSEHFFPGAREEMSGEEIAREELTPNRLKVTYYNFSKVKNRI
jgi:hypothetical protein